jgi:hypothetical protein
MEPVTPEFTPAEPPKKDNKALIIGIVVAVVLCCCCVVVIGLGWQFGDAIIEALGM